MASRAPRESMCALLAWLALGWAAAGAIAGAPTLQRLPNGSYPLDCSRPGVACFPKCCPPGQFLSGKSCVPGDGAQFNPAVVDKFLQNSSDLLVWPVPYYLVIGNPCKAERSIRRNFSYIDVWTSGELVLYNDSHSNKSSNIFKSENFCLEYSKNIDTEAILCDTPESPLLKGLYTSGMVISVTGLVLTLLVYLSVDALRDLHGKSLVCHVGCLAVAYVLLIAVQINDEGSRFSPEVCTGVAFAIQFFLLSSFMWLHVMCLDAFWCVLQATGSSPIPYPRAKLWKYDEIKKQWVTGVTFFEEDEAKEEELKRSDELIEKRAFLVYSFYVWFQSLLPVIAILGHKLSPTISYTYLDHNMEMHCISDSPKTQDSLLYFYPFVGFFMLVNIIIFVCILVKVTKFNWNITGPQRVPKQKARMVFIIFIIMSSNWGIDLISWALQKDKEGEKIVVVFLHAYYIMQGLITFLVFVLEERVKDRIKHNLWPRIQRMNKTYGCCNRKESKEELFLRATSTPSNAQTMGWVVPK